MRGESGIELFETKKMEIAEIQNPQNDKYMLKWVQKNAPGVWRPQGGSKWRCESNGMPPGPQNGNEK